MSSSIDEKECPCCGNTIFVETDHITGKTNASCQTCNWNSDMDDIEFQEHCEKYFNKEIEDDIDNGIY